ncbi:MAG TPA: trigger factor [Terriglobia bacterium]|nr:trigger factor [Terriglobia bacterium]
MEAETCKRELVIQIPFDVVQKESESVAARFARKVRVPGFRPGRAPRDFILRRYRDIIREEVAETLLPKFFGNALKEQNLEIAGEPRFEEPKFEDEKPLTCKATFEVYPPVELGECKGLEVSEDPVTVSDDDVDKAVENLREGAATYEVAEHYPAADGDMLSVSYDGWDVENPKNPLLEVKEGAVRVGEEGTLPEFTENLRGAQAGDTREFEVKYGEDFPQPKLAGKTVKFRVKVHTVRRKVLPAVDDELAKTVSNTASTLEDLRSTLRKSLEELRQRESEGAAKQKLLDRLMEKAAFPVPEVLVEDRLDQKIRMMAGQLFDQGIDPRNQNLNWPKLRGSLRQDAEKDVRGGMILAKIAEAEKIEVSEEEIDEAVRQLAAGGTEPAAALKSRLTRNGGLARLQSSRRNQKALDFVYRNAKVVRQPSPA